MLRAHLTRLVACLFAGFVLAIMVGSQEGSIDDFGVSFQQAMAGGRILIFLGIGLVGFVVLSFWGLLRRYLRHPGVVPLGGGLVVVLASYVVMNWFDPLEDSSYASARFSAVRSAVRATAGLAPVAAAFFGWLAWVLLAVCLVAGGVAVVLRSRVFGYLTGVGGVVSAVIVVISHHAVASKGGGIDHSLGADTAIAGFLLITAAGLVVAVSTRQTANTREFVRALFDWRAGFPYAVVGLVLGLLAFFNSGWYAPQNYNDSLAGVHQRFLGTGLAPLAVQYVIWLGYLLLVATAVLSLAATYYRNRAAGLLAALVGVVSIVLTILSIHAISDLGRADTNVTGGLWANLGPGGWLACVAFSGMAAAGYIAFAANRRTATARTANRGTANRGTAGAGVADGVVGAARRAQSAATIRGSLWLLLAVAVFYPQTLGLAWQSALALQIAPFLLLALGLNVVVGWAGLLDLGYIAFYAIGAYVSAYLTGALPLKPPSWLHFTPLLAIPFAILVCVIAGVLLGAPTLRLRGDYLAIVTLGFGEIIQLAAENNPGNLTNGGVGVKNIPHPVLDLFGLRIVWGGDSLPYWMLLIVLMMIVIALFWRLEGSRIGRSWAAIREDEVAAQATGVNTARVKLLAFAIGASVSGIAGVFYTTQVGYVDPTSFSLQTSILIVAYVVFGGMGSLPGAIAGAAVLTWLPEFLKSQVPSADLQMWVGGIVLLMMIFRPAGLIPAKRRAAELHGLQAAASAETAAVPMSEGL